ncbi:MAG: MotA/TolQ/ExbB proton channel family protein [Candidatus Hydrogenedentes bacterium]|nr:MotA/TolQ/ExbB proton channel family protein [Candidatus Hydrogenedentota bacterium]
MTRSKLAAIGVSLILLVCEGQGAWAQTEAASAVEQLDPIEEVTLEMMVRKGSPILWAIMVLAFIAVVMGLYLFLTVTPRREAPTKLLRRVTNQIRAGDMQGAIMLCEGRDELMARVLHAGLKMADQDRYIIQESMESEGERGAAELWQKISYMNNVGVIAPLLGLLGTVWGMIGAFSAIALDSSQVKSVTMAYNVSQAMITTAAGLLLAIPALLVYYILRGRVLRVVSTVESQASEFVELIIRNQKA